MSNLLKGFFVSVDDEKRVVDTNERTEEYIRREEEKRERELADEMTFEEEEEGFSEGLSAESLDALTSEEAQSAVLKSSQAAEKEALNAELAEIRQQIEDARGEAERILEDAKNEAEAHKNQIYEEAKQAGYTEGTAAGMAAVDSMKQKVEQRGDELEREYQEKFKTLEPQFIDALTDIYEHIFKVDLDSYRDIVEHLLTDTINSADEARNILVHINREDFPGVSEKKEEILTETGMTSDHVEFIPDATLPPGGCMVETDNGIYDCSLGTELKELKQKLMLLSFRKD
ncbi:MAG: hypothetical protein K6F53_10105 [Lachnospiraceae bacterium]|nr:hypothetical protein [Lachnospiraceae bacterium]